MQSFLPWFALAVALSSPLPSLAEGAAGAEIRFANLSRARIPAAIDALARMDSAGARKTVAASAAFVGTRYLRSPLGEGGGVSPGPRIRWDGVDCLTLVETAMAVGQAAHADEVPWILDDIRYADGKEPHFENRLHLMIAQWIPDQIAKGYVEDVTRLWGGEATVEASIDYDPVRWRRRPRVLHALPWNPALEGSHSVPMIPLQEARRIAGELPEGLILNVVRSSRDDRINRITHTGLITVKDGKRYVRHASTHRLEVIDEPIDRFLARHAAMRQWLVDGIHLLRIRDNGERLEKLRSSGAPGASGGSL